MTLTCSDQASVLPFHGIEKTVDAYSGGTAQHGFTPIQAGQTIFQDLDVAETHDLDDETYNLSADGFMLAAAEGSTQLLDWSLPYASNSISLKADSAEAKRTTKAVEKMISKRTTIEGDCSASQKNAIAAANQKCASMATAAADAVSSGSADMFKQYFKNDSQSTREQVTQMYRDVAKECSSTPGGSSTDNCTDPDDCCTGDLLAYTMWQSTWSYSSGPVTTKGTTYYCPRYFDILPAAPEQCRQQSQATNTLHETTHAVAATSDIAYGYPGIMRLSSSQAVKNADTYALFANGMIRGGLASSRLS